MCYRLVSKLTQSNHKELADELHIAVKPIQGMIRSDQIHFI